MGAASVTLRLDAPPAGTASESPPRPGAIRMAAPGEDIWNYLRRTEGEFHLRRYCEILGAANEFKEGDAIVGVAAVDDTSRADARRLLSNTRVGDLAAHPPYRDQLCERIARDVDSQAAAELRPLTLGELKRLLLDAPAPRVHELMRGLTSDTIGCLVKLASHEELVALGRKIFNPLPGSQIGAEGCLSARVQPNSPTDHPDDIRWQVFNAFAYGVGDLLLGTNPVSSDPASVARVQDTLAEILRVFEIADAMPHCVLSHIDVQAAVEAERPGCTALWFQSLAGCDSANATFDIDIRKMVRYASSRRGPFGLYFETGQGADFTNGHAHGFDMVLHEARKYGFARHLARCVRQARLSAGHASAPWVHVNDVAGFIGPEVFRTREQLVRCCLEDIVMGKLHGLCIGLDVCSTLHMDVSLQDLDWCLDQVLPAQPAYLMALPTKIDPMLGYLTTGFQDHLRLRQRFGYRISQRMERFFQTLGVLRDDGTPGPHFGDPARVYLHYCRRQGDPRGDSAIHDEARQQMAAVRGRGVFLTEGHGGQPWELQPEMARDVASIYAEAKRSIWAELRPDFKPSVPARLELASCSHDRTDYILHPESGERLSAASVEAVHDLRSASGERFDAQLVISDGLNALAIMQEGQLLPYLTGVRAALEDAGWHVAPRHLLVHSGRVRLGYRIGELLFGGLAGPRAILHIIGERPGTGHQTLSIYVTAVDGTVWGVAGQVDHNLTRVISGVARTALQPQQAAADTVRLLSHLR